MLGIFKDRQLIRMSDAKMFSEITFAFLYGIKTTTSPSLDGLYRDFDEDFPQAKKTESRIADSINTILGWAEIHNTALMKPHIFYALVLAIAHTKNPVEGLLSKYKPSSGINKNAIVNLTALAEALESEGNAPKKFSDFVSASSRTTNDVKRRTTIFQWICKALELEKI